MSHWRRWAIGAIAVALGVAGWFAWPHTVPISEPPVIELSGIEHESAASIEAAQAEVRNNPRATASWGRLGMILFANEFYPESLLCFEQAERLDAKDLRWPYFQGLIILKRNPAEALPALERAAALAGQDFVLHLRLAETDLQLYRFPEAAQEYRRVLAIDPGNPQGLLGLGQSLLQQGDARASLPYLTAAAASPLTRKAATSALAQVHEHLGDNQATAKAAREAAELPTDPMWNDPYRTQALDLLAGPQARCFYASTLLDKGQTRKAVAIAEDIVRQRPNSDQAFVILAEAYKRLGRPVDAERAVREALRLKPDAYWPTYFLGGLRYEQNDFKEAADLFRCALRLKPGDVAAYDNLGLCQLRLGDKAGAIENWKTGLRFHPNAVAIHFHYGDFLAQEGRIAEAQEHLELAKRLDPNNEKVEKRLAEVKRNPKEHREHKE
jgi:tetratricopeptide (TPR) repeat protein